ncbi:WD repeat-containing protein 41-like isoform X3 [Sinocyclocheilus rhinocerous]|uniref:WD repeat-containing protein 41-like isoform X3 n=1 Tax=Sinocyclocheilus rhinocerous TaxID=307959 RepID=UPI0007B837B6|nr:PREDICTED: WD repeat-containing protein 41-like isoform X3 [Sinocyclocheilus rhinocerous]
MLRWILGGREAQGTVEKSAALFIGEEQPKNCFTEMQVLKGHFDIVRFLVQVDDLRFASAGDDGLVLIWNVETGDSLIELRGHTQQITAMISYTFIRGGNAHTALITASSDRTLSLWDPDSGNRVQNISDLQSPVKCLLVLVRLDVWLSGGNELCVWNRDFELQCKTVHHSDAVIFKLNLSGSDIVVMAMRHLADHQDTIHSLIHINDGLFASGSHIGELIIWDSVDWTIQAYEHILWEEPARDGQSEFKLNHQKQIERSIQHMSSDGEYIVAAVGSGLYVYNVLMKSVVAYRRIAHDSNVLHTVLQQDGRLMSCSEDGSVRMWELQDLPLPAEPASSGFFGMFGTFGRSSKQTGPPAKKIPEVPGLRSLELIGDLIGHSGAVQMFLSFKEKGLVTCSTDHLLIIWKDGEFQSQLRSLAVFQKLEENQEL